MGDLNALWREAASALRRHDFAAARHLLAEATPGGAWQARWLATLRWAVAPFWWQPLGAGGCVLWRRGAQDLGFVRSVWAKADFIRSLYPLAPPLPARDDELSAILESEYVATVIDHRALHWTVRDAGGKPWGFIDLADISLPHCRAELVLGVLPDAPQYLGCRALLLMGSFAFGGMPLNKLCALVAAGNVAALRPALKFGFSRTRGRSASTSATPKAAGTSTWWRSASLAPRLKAIAFAGCRRGCWRPAGGRNQRRGYRTHDRPRAERRCATAATGVAQMAGAMACSGGKRSGQSASGKTRHQPDASHRPEPQQMRRSADSDGRASCRRRHDTRQA